MKNVTKKIESKEIVSGIRVTLEKGRRYYVAFRKQTVRPKRPVKVEIRDQKTDSVVKIVSIPADTVLGFGAFFPNGEKW